MAVDLEAYHQEPRKTTVTRWNTGDSLSKLHQKPKNLLKKMYEKALHAVGPQAAVKSSNHTVVLALFAFMCFLTFISAAVRFPTRKVKAAFIATTSVLICFVALLVLRDFVKPSYRSREYRRNLGNTVFTVLFTMILLLVVYSRSWYYDLNINVLQDQSDILDSPRFPAVVVLQDTRQATQPNLVDSQPPKCWSGLYNESAPPCETLSAQQYSDLPSCNCNNSWSSNLNGSFYWTVGAFNYFLFTPPSNVISKHPGYHMTLQVYFNFNASEAFSFLHVTPSPDLQVAIFDPASGLEQALDSGYSPLNIFNANGLSYINLNLNLHHDIGTNPVYDYSPTISNSPNIGIVCDISANRTTDLCYTSLEIQFTSHVRTTTVQRRGMTWTAAASSAGAYFALVQFLSWIVSGQVWAT